MKKLAEKCLFMVVALAVLLLLFCAIYRYTGAEQKMWIVDKSEKFHPVPEDIDVAVLGSSHAQMGMRSGPEGHTFFNFALSSQMPPYDLAMLRQYKDKIEENALVILTVSYMSPYWYETETEFQRKQGRYYRLLDPENIVDVNWAQYYLLKAFPVLGVEPNTLIHNIFLPVKRDKEAVLAEEDLRTIEHQIETEALQHWSYMIEQTFPQPVTWDTYEEIYRLCQKNHWQAVMVTTPFTEYYNNNCFPAEFYPTFCETVNSFAEEHGIQYFDYSHDEEFTTAKSLFRDIDHLNKAGAAQFEECLYRDLEEAGLL